MKISKQKETFDFQIPVLQVYIIKTPLIGQISLLQLKMENKMLNATYKHLLGWLQAKRK